MTPKTSCDVTLGVIYPYESYAMLRASKK